MATVNNPYSDLLGIMALQGAVNNPPGLKLGTIKSINPLIVGVDGLELNESFVKVSETLKPHKRQAKLNGDFNIKLNTAYTPTISTYNMPSKKIGLTATSTATSTPTVTGGDGTVIVSVSTSVNTTINNDSHTHGSHSHTASSLNSVVGNGTFTGSIEYTDWAIKTGDTVVVLSSNDKQSYVVIAKI